MPGAVFLSYASQDAEAARRLFEALQAVGVEVWFDQSELRGGDAWDAKIKKQIRECALFVPVISRNTNSRGEGYFRLEWKLAVDRSHLMADDATFIVPVVIDEMTDAEVRVPDRFREVQWTRLGPKRTPESFADRISAVLAGHLPGEPAENPAADARRSSATRPMRTRKTSFRTIAWLTGVLACAGLALLKERLNQSGVERVVPNALGDVAGQTSALGTTRSTPQITNARALALKARAMSLDKYDSTADDFAAAEALLNQALDQDPNDAEIWAISSQLNGGIQGRGFASSSERTEAARSQAERALSLDPDSIEGRYALGYWQARNDPDLKVAEKTLRAVLELAPDHSNALRSLAGIESRLGHAAESLALYEKVAQNPARMPLARYQEYLVYFDHAQFAEAERCLRVSIASQPSANSVTGLAMVLLTAEGDAPAAVQTLAQIPDSARNENRTVWVSAYAHLLVRQPDAALDDLSRLPADFIQDNWFAGPKAYWVGRAHAEAGRPAAARVAFESALAMMEARVKQAPTDTFLRPLLGELLAWLHREPEAMDEMRTVAELNRDPVSPWFISPVKIYAVLGRTDEALPLLEKLLAYNTDGKYPGFQGWPLTPALLRIDPLWDRLRGDPRFQALLADPSASRAGQH